MNRFITSHPLLLVLVVTAVLRLPAVIFSKGYMASDDHFETISVASRWIVNSPLAEDGLRTVPHRPPERHARFPLYNLFLYGIFWVNIKCGIRSLDGIMYSVRAIHAALSLLSVWAVYRIVQVATGSTRWAIWGGLAAAGHFLMPFLGVRNLIEMVGGHLWIVAVYFLYRGTTEREDRWLLAAGVVTGLAWMIRFEIAFAAIGIPVVLWWHRRSLHQAVVYAAAVAGMLLLAGITDWLLLNKFMASSINHIRQVLVEPPPYRTTPFIYLLVILAAFIPPFSLIAVWLGAARDLLRQHALLWAPSALFVLAHTLSTSRQERYMVTILPALIAFVVIAVWYHVQRGGLLYRQRWLGKSLLAGFIACNIVLLIPFTINYGHKGLVAPLVYAGDGQQRPTVMMVSPDNSSLYPCEYAALTLPGRRFIHSWEELANLEDSQRAINRTDYFLLYPKDSSQLQPLLDSLRRYGVTLEELLHVEPSAVEFILHRLNPRHNRTHEAWIFRRESDLSSTGTPAADDHRHD